MEGGGKEGKAQARGKRKRKKTKQYPGRVSLAYLDKPQGQVHPTAILDMRGLAERGGPQQGNYKLGREGEVLLSNALKKKHRLSCPTIILFTLCCDTTSLQQQNLSSQISEGALGPQSHIATVFAGVNV